MALYYIANNAGEVWTGENWTTVKGFATAYDIESGAAVIGRRFFHMRPRPRLVEIPPKRTKKTGPKSYDSLYRFAKIVTCENKRQSDKPN